MEVRAKYVTTLDKSIAIALNYEDAKGRPSGFVQAGPQLEYPRKGGVSKEVDNEIKCPIAKWPTQARETE